MSMMQRALAVTGAGDAKLQDRMHNETEGTRTEIRNVADNLADLAAVVDRRMQIQPEVQEKPWQMAHIHPHPDMERILSFTQKALDDVHRLTKIADPVRGVQDRLSQIEKRVETTLDRITGAVQKAFVDAQAKDANAATDRSALVAAQRLAQAALEPLTRMLKTRGMGALFSAANNDSATAIRIAYQSMGNVLEIRTWRLHVCLVRRWLALACYHLIVYGTQPLPNRTTPLAMTLMSTGSGGVHVDNMLALLRTEERLRAEEERVAGERRRAGDDPPAPAPPMAFSVLRSVFTGIGSPVSPALATRLLQIIRLWDAYEDSIFEIELNQWNADTIPFRDDQKLNQNIPDKEANDNEVYLAALVATPKVKAINTSAYCHVGTQSQAQDPRAAFSRLEGLHTLLIEEIGCDADDVGERLGHRIDSVTARGTWEAFRRYCERTVVAYALKGNTNALTGVNKRTEVKQPVDMTTALLPTRELLQRPEHDTATKWIAYGDSLEIDNVFRERLAGVYASLLKLVEQAGFIDTAMANKGLSDLDKRLRDVSTEISTGFVEAYKEVARDVMHFTVEATGNLREEVSLTHYAALRDMSSNALEALGSSILKGKAGKYSKYFADTWKARERSRMDYQLGTDAFAKGVGRLSQRKGASIRSATELVNRLALYIDELVAGNAGSNGAGGSPIGLDSAASLLLYSDSWFHRIVAYVDRVRGFLDDDRPMRAFGRFVVTDVLFAPFSQIETLPKPEDDRKAVDDAAVAEDGGGDVPKDALAVLRTEGGMATRKHIDLLFRYINAYDQAWTYDFMKALQLAFEVIASPIVRAYTVSALHLLASVCQLALENDPMTKAQRVKNFQSAFFDGIRHLKPNSNARFFEWIFARVAMDSRARDTLAHMVALNIRRYASDAQSAAMRFADSSRSGFSSSHRNEVITEGIRLYMFSDAQAKLLRSMIEIVMNFP